MSEQPISGKVTSIDDYRQGSPLGDGDQFDLHKYVAVPKYNQEAINRVHEQEAARQAREAVIAAERLAEMNELDPRPAAQEIANIVAMRKAIISGQIEGRSAA